MDDAVKRSGLLDLLGGPLQRGHGRGASPAVPNHCNALRSPLPLRVERADFTKRLGASYVPGGAGLGLRIVDELCDRWEAASGRVTAWYRI